MNERNIEPPIFTAEVRGAIKLRADFETRSYIEALEEVARAADQFWQANDEMTRGRVKMGIHLTRVNFMR